MKFKVAGALFCLLLVLVAAATPVYGGATVNSATFPFSDEFQSASPCTGDPVTINIIGVATLHTVETLSGTVQGTFKLRADLIETNAITGEVAQGTVNWNQSFGSDPETFVINGKIVHPGPGNNVIVHFLAHVSPNGMSFDSGETDECR